jgi:hypothetical protein
MRTAPSYCELPRHVQPTSNQAVKFKDGMIVKAEDLDAATRHPLAVFQTLVRAYFGCGIVCGLKVDIIKNPPRQPANGGTTGYGPQTGGGTTGGGATGGGTTTEGTAAPERPSFTLCVNPGVALGCDGYPIELCKPVKFELKSDPCCPLPETFKFCVAIRRCESDDVPRADCGCQHGNCGCGTSATAPRYQCTRINEHVIVEIFSGDGPQGMCMRPTRPENPEKVCDCLTACSDCGSYGESWVLLDNFIYHQTAGIKPDEWSKRKLVKPTQCICDVRAAAR